MSTDHLCRRSKGAEPNEKTGGSLPARRDRAVVVSSGSSEASDRARHMHVASLDTVAERAEPGKGTTLRLDNWGEETTMGNELVALAIASLAAIVVMVIMAIASLQAPPPE